MTLLKQKLLGLCYVTVMCSGPVQSPRAKEQLNRLCLKIATDTENLCVCTQGVVQQWPTAY